MSGPNPYRRETRDRQPHGNAVGIGGSPNKGAARGGQRPCLDLRRDEASHVALVQTPSAVGAIPIVDFLLYHFAVIVKKMAVKSQDWDPATDSVFRSPHGAKRNAGKPIRSH